MAVSKVIRPKLDEQRKKFLDEVRIEQGFYTSKELSDKFTIPHTTILNSIKHGDLKTFSPNNKVRYIKLSEFKALFQI